jgi:hypothetical protein
MQIRIATVMMLTAAALAAAPVQPPRLKAAFAIVDSIDADKNSYSYDNPYVNWKGTTENDAYEVHCDCSFFIDALEAHADGLTVDDLQKLTGTKHPHARQWYEAVAKAPADGPLVKIDKLADAKPGDFLVTAYPPDEGKRDTGHIMLLAETPVKRTASEPVIDGTTQWDVPVIDSSKSHHGKDDTRVHADGTTGSGVGKGIFRLYTKADGTVAGYAWSDSVKSVYVPQKEHPFAIARLDAEKLKAAAAPRKPMRLQAAEALVDGLDHDHNKYDRNGLDVHWKDVDGYPINNVKASAGGFIDMVLVETDGFTTDDFKRLTGVQLPDGPQWFDAIDRAGDNGPLQKVAKLADARPGDLIAVRFPPGRRTAPGHVMMLAGDPVKRDATAPKVDGTTQWDVPVIDCSARDHGDKDTRQLEDGTSGQGVGRGMLRVYTSADGSTAGYAWDDSETADFRAKPDYGLVIGRIDEQKLKASR